MHLTDARTALAGHPHHGGDDARGDEPPAAAAGPSAARDGLRGQLPARLTTLDGPPG